MDNSCGQSKRDPAAAHPIGTVPAMTSTYLPNRRRPPPTPHLYRDDGTRDADDLGRCVHDGLPESNARHTFPTVPDHAVEAEQRRTGDR